MRYFRYIEQGWPEDAPAITVTISEQQILREYWAWWQAQMRKAGKADLISPQGCLEDFCVVHWAWELSSSERDDPIRTASPDSRQ